MISDVCVFFFQAEDGIRDLVRSRGLGDVYKRQAPDNRTTPIVDFQDNDTWFGIEDAGQTSQWQASTCLLYTSDAADERSSVDLGGRRIIKKKKQIQRIGVCDTKQKYNIMRTIS